MSAKTNNIKTRREMNIKKRKGKYIVEIDSEKFERLASIFGFYNPDFLKLLEKSLKEYKKGNIKPIEDLL